MHLRVLQECVDEDLETLPYTKVVYFMRHGQSFANRRPMRERQHDESLTDSRLTELGMLQCRDMQLFVKRFNAQLVVCSPLTRSIQTACIAFEKETSSPLLAWPMCTEFYPQYPESQGRVVDKLRMDESLTSLPRFKDMCLNNVVGEWWASASEYSRVYAFIAWLRFTPLSRIAVVSHSGFIRAVVKAARFGGELSLHNCSWLSTRWHASSLQRHILASGETQEETPPLREYSIWLEPDTTVRCELLREMRQFLEVVKKDGKLSQAKFVRPGHDYSNDIGSAFHVTICDFVPLYFEDVVQLSQALRLSVDRMLSNLPDIKRSWTIDMEREEGHPLITLKIADEKFLHARIIFLSKHLSELVDSVRKLSCFENYPLSLRKEFRATLLEDSDVRDVFPASIPISSPPPSFDVNDGAFSPLSTACGEQQQPVPKMERRYSLGLSDFSEILVPNKFPLLNSVLCMAKFQQAKEKEQEAVLLDMVSSGEMPHLYDEFHEASIHMGFEVDDKMLKFPSTIMECDFDSEEPPECIAQYSEFLRQFCELRWQLCVMVRPVGDVISMTEREPGLTMPLWA